MLAAECSKDKKDNALLYHMLKIEIIKYILVQNVMHGIFHCNENYILNQKQWDPSATNPRGINSQYWC